MAQFINQNSKSDLMLLILYPQVFKCYLLTIKYIIFQTSLQIFHQYHLTYLECISLLTHHLILSFSMWIWFHVVLLTISNSLYHT